MFFVGEGNGLSLYKFSVNVYAVSSEQGLLFARVCRNEIQELVLRFGFRQQGLSAQVYQPVLLVCIK